MRAFAAMIVGLLLAASAWGQTAIDPSSLYISDPLKWERGRRPGQPPKKLALGSIVVLEPDGRLAAISCFLYMDSDNHLAVIYGHGYSISSGTWEKAGDHLAVRLRSIHGVRKVGETNATFREESWAYGRAREGGRIAEWIKIAGTRYVPLRNLSDIKQLTETIQFYRKEAEALK